MRGMQVSVGRIVFLTLLCMSLGTFAISFISVYGVQSFRHEFDRLVEKDLPQATIATRLNAEISGLTSQIGVLTSANSEIALGTFRIQIGDQLEAINRLKDQLRQFALRPGEYTEIDNSLNKLTANLEQITTLSVQRLRSEARFAQLATRARNDIAADDTGLAVLLWMQELTNAQRPQTLDRLERALSADLDSSAARALGGELLEERRTGIGIGTAIQGRLNQHRQLSARLTDSTRFMSARLIDDANRRSAVIQNLIRTNSYLILASFLTFATIATFIYVYLGKQVVARIQLLTRRINAYEGRGGDDPQGPSRNEIDTFETAFDSLIEKIAERESRLVALNAAATEARREAEKANLSKSRLLAAASHDLRQPVHAMGLLIGGINRASLDEGSHRTVDQLANLTRETAQLFDSILDMSKLEAGTFTAAREQVNLAGLFARVRAEFTPRAEMAGADLHIAPPARDIFVLGDSEALYRIISNLLVNAIQYANQGAIALSVQTGPDECIVTVSDNGPGLISPQNGAPENTAALGTKGYGLGLSISFALAVAMRTRLTFECPEGGGTRFSLPLQRVAPADQAESAPPGARARAPNLENLHIVLLEDEPDVHSATKDALTRLGCKVSPCNTAEQARDAIAKATQPFVLVSDMNLGRGHSATDLVSHVLEHGRHLIGVVMTTASPNALPESWRAHDKLQILEKPFSIARLASLVRFMSLGR